MQHQEQQRLQIIDEFYLHKGEQDTALQALLLSLSTLLDMPIALVSVIDQYEQFFKAKVGLDVDSTRREDAFCNLVVGNNQPLVVEDAKLDPRFANNPLVTAQPQIRFYAGVPLQLAQVTVGAVCMIDRQPRQLTEAQLAALTALSQHVSQYLYLAKERILLQQEHGLLDNSPAVLLKWRQFHSLQLSYVSANIESLFGINAAMLREREAVLEDFIETDDLAELHFLLTNHAAGVPQAEAHFRLCSPGGRQYRVKLITKAYFNDDGKLHSVHAMLTDHTTNYQIEQKLTDTNQQLRLLLEASNLGTWDWHIQKDSSKVNLRWCEMLGLDYELYDPSSQFWRQLIHPADRLRLEQELQQHLAGDSAIFNTCYRMRHRDGHWVWIETYGKVVERNADGKPTRLAGTHRDITYRKEAELSDAKQRQLLSFINKAQAYYLQQHDLSAACRQILPELIELADSQFAFIGQMRRQQGKDRLYIHAITELAWNEQSDQLVQQYQQGNLYFDRFDNLFGQVIISGEVVLTNQPAQHPAARGTPRGHPKIFRFLGLPIKIKHELVGMIGLANKSVPYIEADADFLQPLCDALAGLYYAVGLEEARHKAEQQLKNLAMTDPLTGIANRRAFIEHCARLRNSVNGYVLAIVDLDHFKQINDSYGHQTGDDVLKMVAQQLRQQLRTDDYSARLGGEEFAILIEHTEIDSANLLLENLRVSIADQQLSVNGQSIRVTISIGARYVSPDEDEDLTRQMCDADTALYNAKHSGRNCLMWF